MSLRSFRSGRGPRPFGIVRKPKGGLDSPYGRAPEKNQSLPALLDVAPAPFWRYWRRESRDLVSAASAFVATSRLTYTWFGKVFSSKDVLPT